VEERREAEERTICEEQQAPVFIFYTSISEGFISLATHEHVYTHASKPLFAAGYNCITNSYQIGIRIFVRLRSRNLLAKNLELLFTHILFVGRRE